MQDLRSANKRRRRQQILQGAHTLISRDGVRALTMRSLAEESSVSVPTIYALVGGRDDVIAALMDSGVHRFDAGVAALDSRGLFRATAIVELFADILDHERELLHALLASGALNKMRARLDPSSVNGGPLLGLNGTVVKSHGGADPRGFANAVMVAANLAASDYAAEIARTMQRLADMKSKSDAAASAEI